MNRFVTVQKFGQAYKLIYHNGGMQNGNTKKKEARARDDDGCDNGDDGEHALDRLGNNVARARSRIRELALCNDWDYFVTLTLSPEKCDRSNLRDFVSRFGQFIRNYNRLRDERARYLIIPEQHKDASWHAHGFLSGISPDSLEKNEHGYLDWPAYRRAFGFISLSVVRDRVRAAAYITKYVSKGIGATPREAGEHLFYASKGLAGKETLGGFWCDLPAEYETEHCGITWANPDSQLSKILDGCDFSGKPRLADMLPLMYELALRVHSS